MQIIAKRNILFNTSTTWYRGKWVCGEQHKKTNVYSGKLPFVEICLWTEPTRGLVLQQMQLRKQSLSNEGHCYRYVDSSIFSIVYKHSMKMWLTRENLDNIKQSMVHTKWKITQEYRGLSQ